MEDEKREGKNPNKFVAFIKAVFVHNIGWKLLALFSSAVMWALIAGLW